MLPEALPLPQRTPAGARSGLSSEVLVRRYGPGVRPRLSVQREFNLGSGIVRGARDAAGHLVPDHVVSLDGTRLFGPDMRRGTITVWEHQVRALMAAPRPERVVAVVGNGNLTQNPGFVAWVGAEAGLLVRVQGEPVLSRIYECVVLDDLGAVSIRRLRFEPGAGRDAVGGWLALDVDDGERPLSRDAVAFSGQRLVRAGRALDAHERRRQILDGLFYDLRHVFRFPAVHAGGLWRDVGLETLFAGGGLDGGMLAETLAGGPLRTRWAGFGVERGVLERALADKGYVPGDPDAGGRYRFDGDVLTFTPLPGIYPHNVFGVDQQGQPASLLVTGWSNNAGYTVDQLAEAAGRLFRDAVLLDNGGDVFLLENRDAGSLLIPPALAWNGSGRLVPGPLPGADVQGFAEGRFTLRSVLLFMEDAAGPNRG